MDVGIEQNPAYGFVIAMNKLTSWIIDPVKFAKVNVWGTWFWIAMVPISVFTGWVSLVEYVSALSIYALAGFHLSTYAAARTEIMQSETDNKLQQALEEINEILLKMRKFDPDDDRE